MAGIQRRGMGVKNLGISVLGNKPDFRIDNFPGTKPRRNHYDYDPALSTDYREEMKFT